MYYTTMMVSSSKIVFFVPMLLTILVALQVTNGEYKYEAFFPKVEVVIRNNMSGTPAGLHCKDKDHDDGFHRIDYGEIHSFSVIDVKVCPAHCNWSINQSGPCRISETTLECFPWNEWNNALNV
ncbi:unnamed protein product [Vicia faba]|uniref:S-protein homolog n=1 Tax=Vicia faba TaxID=3906 RepID=A0AAV0Z308_VICFA|nr:unnamed protein product [Vicia faba]